MPQLKLPSPNLPSHKPLGLFVGLTPREDLDPQGAVQKPLPVRNDGDGIPPCRRACRSDIYVRHICDPCCEGEKAGPHVCGPYAREMTLRRSLNAGMSVLHSRLVDFFNIPLKGGVNFFIRWLCPILKGAAKFNSMRATQNRFPGLFQQPRMPSLRSLLPAFPTARSALSPPKNPCFTRDAYRNLGVLTFFAFFQAYTRPLRRIAETKQRTSSTPR